MHYAVCGVPLAPIRIEPNHKSEMISQLLFGEFCTVIEEDKSGWVKIICKADNYCGWCQQMQVQQIDKLQYDNSELILTAGWINELDFNGQVMIVPFGILLTTIKNGKIVWGNNTVGFNGELWKPFKSKKDDKKSEKQDSGYSPF